jgi:hypothetical protein
MRRRKLHEASGLYSCVKSNIWAQSVKPDDSVGDGAVINQEWGFQSGLAVCEGNFVSDAVVAWRG